MACEAEWIVQSLVQCDVVPVQRKETKMNPEEVKARDVMAALWVRLGVKLKKGVRHG
jgi:hypothetical protein